MRLRCNTDISRSLLVSATAPRLIGMSSNKRLREAPPWGDQTICSSLFFFCSWMILLLLLCVQGQPEFLGRAMATPKLKLEHEQYVPTQLVWLDLFRGSTKAGQLLASFELLEVCLFSLCSNSLRWFLEAVVRSWHHQRLHSQHSSV